jgi:hypothetical protein
MASTTIPHPINPRLESIYILRQNHIKPCLWAEDALGFYQVPTVVFELYLLVPDEELQTASTILSSSPGYRQVPPDAEEMQVSRSRQVFLKYWSHRFMGSWSDVTGVQLLPAQEFAHFTISGNTTVMRDFCIFPKLSSFIEALVEKYLESATNRGEVAYLAYIGMHLLYLGAFAVERYSVVDDLSPRASLLWKDVVEEKFIFGEKGRDIYRKG